MKRILLLLLLVSSSAFAQSNSITFSLLQPQFGGESAIAEGERIPVGLASRTGFAIGAERRFGRFSAGIHASRLSSPASAEDIRVGSLTLTPISANVALHGSGRRIAPYAGAGAAYVMTSNLRSDTIGRVDVGNDVTWLLNAGVNVRATERFSVNFDIRYMPIGVDVKANGTGGDLEFRTITTGAGLRWNF